MDILTLPIIVLIILVLYFLVKEFKNEDAEVTDLLHEMSKALTSATDISINSHGLKGLINDRDFSINMLSTSQPTRAFHGFDIVLYGTFPKQKLFMLKYPEYSNGVIRSGNKLTKKIEFKNFSTSELPALLKSSLDEMLEIAYELDSGNK